MRLTMSPATVEDVPGLAAILFEEYMEMHEWTRVRFEAVDPEDRHRYLAAGLREDLTCPKAPLVIQKMVDEDSGDIVAFLQLNDCNVPPNPRDDVEPIVKPKGYNVPPMLEHYDKMIAAQKAAMGDVPFMHIADLATKISHRRRGISSTLMRWGMELADKRKMPIYVEATPDGKFLYDKLGWETVDSWSVDLTKYGGTGTYVEVGMRYTPC